MRRLHDYYIALRALCKIDPELATKATNYEKFTYEVIFMKYRRTSYIHKL